MTMPQATRPQDNKKDGKEKKDSLTTKLDEILVIDTEDIPDSLLHPRWKIQRTIPATFEDLKQDRKSVV